MGSNLEVTLIGSIMENMFLKDGEWNLENYVGEEENKMEEFCFKEEIEASKLYLSIQLCKLTFEYMQLSNATFFIF